MTGDLVIGWPNSVGRSSVTDRDTGRVLGFTREEVVGLRTSRWFAEAADRTPLEGTYGTKRAAAEAVAEACRVEVAQ